MLSSFFFLDIIISNLFSQIILGIIIFHFLGISIFYIIGQNILYERIKIMLIKAYKLRAKSNNIRKNNFNYIKTKEPPRKKVISFSSRNLANNTDSKTFLNTKRNNNKNIIKLLPAKKNKIFINTKNKNTDKKQIMNLIHYHIMMQ